MKKNLIVLLTIFGITLLFVGAFIYEKRQVHVFNLNTYENTDNIYYDVTDIKNDDEYLKIYGWAINKGVTYDFYNWIIKDGKSVYINTTIALVKADMVYEIYTTTDYGVMINDIINDGIDYRNSGFVSIVDTSTFKIAGEYNVAIIITTINGDKLITITDEVIYI